MFDGLFTTVCRYTPKTFVNILLHELKVETNEVLQNENNE